MTVYYVYNGHTQQINLQSLGEDIQESGVITSATYLGAIWNKGCNTTQKPPCTSHCDQPCNGLLEVLFSNELSVEDKLTLDNIVSNY